MNNIYPTNPHAEQQLLHFAATAHSPAEYPLAFSFPPNNSTEAGPPGNTTLGSLIPRLDALLVVLKTCKGRACTHPWSVLHLAEDVSNLHDALNTRFDEYYEVQLQDQRVHFTKCEKGYIAESEGPMSVEPYGLQMMVHEVAY